MNLKTLLERALFPLVVILVLIAAACGDDDGGTATPDATADASPTEPGESPADSAVPTSSARDNPDVATEGACGFLSAREAEAVIGPLDGEPEEDGDTCAWTGESGTLTATLQETASGEDADDLLTEIAGDSAEAAPALDESYYTGPSSIVGRRGVYVYEVSAEGGVGDLRSLLTSAVGRAAGRLPASEE